MPGCDDQSFHIVDAAHDRTSPSNRFHNGKVACLAGHDVSQSPVLYNATLRDPSPQLIARARVDGDHVDCLRQRDAGVTRPADVDRPIRARVHFRRDGVRACALPTLGLCGRQRDLREEHIWGDVGTQSERFRRWCADHDAVRAGPGYGKRWEQAG
jgi:hypothetical protein